MQPFRPPMEYGLLRNLWWFRARVIQSVLAGRSGYTGLEWAALVWSTEREESLATTTMALFLPRGMECCWSAKTPDIQWKMQFHASVCLLGDLRDKKRCWRKIDYPVCSTVAEWKFFLAPPVLGPFLMLMFPISTLAKSHRMQLTDWNGKLILRFSSCICHSLTLSPSVSCLVFCKMRINI